MIVGMLIKNYKIYYGLHFIPISNNYNFSTFIGENGTGKSSILEALDTYFNNRIWNINNKSKSRGRTGANIPHCSVITLINKSKIKNTKENEKNNKILEKLSAFLWDLKIDNFPNSEPAKKLITYIKDIDIKYQETHFLSISGIRYDYGNEIFLSSLEPIIAKLFEFEYSNTDEIKNKNFKDYFKTYNQYIRNFYSYIYIPVEVGVEKFTKLESNNMQKLMGKNIKDEVSKVITSNGLMTINKNLNSFIKENEKKLSNYFYKNKGGRTNISMNELSEKIIDLFFSIRTLHKKNEATNPTPVEELSSGEKRQALIDVAKTFLTTQKLEDSEVILTIDEPEASLSISKNFIQFEKLITLSKLKNLQVIITTHWYGFLPIVTDGIAHFLNLDNLSITSFDLYNYREKLKHIKTNNYKQMPYDITLKSYNDLIQSILSSIRLDDPYNWLICEGSSEKIYFDYYFKDLIENNNLRILPVGGASEVKKIYEYLELPLKDKEDKINGKIYCLIDTDNKSLEFKTGNYKNLVAYRLLNKNNKTVLVKTDNNEYTPPTEIEDCLNGNIFIKSLESFEDDIVNTILSDKNNIKDKNLNSYNCFNLRQDDKQKIKDFFDTNKGYKKIEFAKKYIELSEEDNHNLEWIQEIKNFFKDK